MADEANNDTTKIPGVPEGVTAADLNDGEGTAGAPKAPVVSNEPPAKQETAEEKAAREKTEKEAADKKAADDKATADAEAKKKADEEEAAKEGKKEYAVYGDESADSAIALLKEAGVAPEEADKYFSKAIESGKLEDIDVKGLTEKVGKEKANLILLGVKDYHTRVTATVTKVVEEVYKVTGGKDQFDALAKWAQEREKTDGAFGTQLNEFRTMLDGTPTQARLAAQELVKLYNADPKTKSLNVTITHGDSTYSSGLDLQYINRADYVSALKVAEDKRDTAEVARLNARRKASVQREKSPQR